MIFSIWFIIGIMGIFIVVIPAKPTESCGDIISDKIIHNTVSRLQTQHSQDSIRIIILRDSIAHMVVTSSMADRSWRYVEIRRYWNICQKNPKNKKFFYGWCSRVIQRK